VKAGEAKMRMKERCFRKERWEMGEKAGKERLRDEDEAER